MNKNFKVFQIHGLSGLLVIAFIATGIFCGFVLFPIWAVMMCWNEIVGVVFKGPLISYYQATLLWMFVVLSFYLALRNSISIKIHKSDSPEVEEISEQLKEVAEKEEQE